MEATNSGQRRLVARKEAMFRLAMGKQKFDQYAASGAVPTVRVGGRIFVRSDILEDLIENPEKMNVQRRAS